MHRNNQPNEEIYKQTYYQIKKDGVKNKSGQIDNLTRALTQHIAIIIMIKITKATQTVIPMIIVQGIHKETD